MALQALNSPNHQDSWTNRSSSKRPRSDVEEEQFLVDCLLKLARGGGANSNSNSNSDERKPDSVAPIPDAGSYNCSVCGRGFSSFQALGGHKASHRKSVPSSSSSAADREHVSAAAVAGGGRAHQCSTCYKSFPTGQALGGHMRCHYEGGINYKKVGGGGGISVRASSESANGAEAAAKSQSQSQSQNRGGGFGLGFDFDLNLPASPELVEEGRPNEEELARKKMVKEDEVDGPLSGDKQRLSLGLQVTHSPI